MAELLRPLKRLWQTDSNRLAEDQTKFGDEGYVKNPIYEHKLPFEKSVAALADFKNTLDVFVSVESPRAEDFEPVRKLWSKLDLLRTPEAQNLQQLMFAAYRKYEDMAETIYVRQVKNWLPGMSEFYLAKCVADLQFFEDNSLTTRALAYKLYDAIQKVPAIQARVRSTAAWQTLIKLSR